MSVNFLFNLPFWKNASSKRKRIYSAFFVVILIVVVTIIGFAIPPSSQDEKLLYNQLNQLQTQGIATGTLPLDFFIHNFLLCLLMFIPLVGLPIGLFIMFSTGQGFRALIDVQIASGVSSATPQIQASTAILILAGAVLTFIFEYTSYTLGMTESIWLFRRLTQRRWHELKYTAIFIGVAALLLTIAAIVESWAVSMPI
jgi:hypothetical protein